MGYKDAEKQKTYLHQYYLDNKEKYSKASTAFRLRNPGYIQTHNREHGVMVKERLYGIKAASGCVDCGERNPIVLDFDHVLGNKKFTIGRGQHRSWTKVEAEIAKCVVRCSNCHRKVTHERRQENKKET